MGDHPIAQLFAQLDARPSPEFEASLRARLVAELASPVAAATGSPPTYMEEYVTATIAPPEASTPPSHRRRWLMPAVAAAAAIAVAAVGVAVLRDDTTTSDSGPAAPTTLVPGERVFDTEIALIATDGTSLWSTREGSRELLRIDPRKHEITDRYELPSPASGTNLFFDGTFVNVITGAGLTRFDPDAGTFGPVLDLGPRPMLALAATDDAMWLLRSGWSPDNPTGVNTVERWDRDFTTLEASTDIGAAEPGGITAGLGSVWVSTGEGGNEIVRLDIATNQEVARIPDVGYSFSLSIGAGSLWAPNYDDGSVARIDPATNTVAARIQVGPDRAHSVAATDNSVWVTSFTLGEVGVISPATNEITALAKVQVGSPMGVVLVGDVAWVAATGQTRSVTGG